MARLYRADQARSLLGPPELLPAGGGYKEKRSRGATLPGNDGSAGSRPQGQAWITTRGFG